MASQRSIRLAIIGLGGMGTAGHLRTFKRLPGCAVTAVCDIDRKRAEDVAEEFDVPESYGDMAELLETSDAEAVVIATPDRFHTENAIAALKAKRHVFCEKPLATNYADARKMAAAAKRSGCINMVNFSYRNYPALQKAAALVRKGKIGQLVHFEASYLQSWLSSTVWGDWKTTPGWLWRLSTEHGSKGVLGDVGVHILDFVLFPAGEPRQVQAQLKTFDKIKGRRMGNYLLDANDSAAILLELKNGALGVVHTTRWATGHENDLRLRLYGTEGAIDLDARRSKETLEVCIGKARHSAQWKSMRCKKTPTNSERFLHSIRTGKNDQPDFATGARVQKLLDACFRSDAENRPVTLR